MRVGTIRLVAIAAGLSALGLAATGARAEDYGPFKEQKTKSGNVLADAKGMTLYTYDKDKSGESACTGKCADAWLPAKASASDKASGGFTVIKRPDGSMQ
jgi:predicted lipoprotein with Yx(FWY)xxD motif